MVLLEFMECLRDKLKLSQIWLTTQTIFEQTIFSKIVKIVCIGTLMKTSFLAVDCVSNHNNE